MVGVRKANVMYVSYSLTCTTIISEHTLFTNTARIIVSSSGLYTFSSHKKTAAIFELWGAGRVNNERKKEKNETNENYAPGVKIDPSPQNL